MAIKKDIFIAIGTYLKATLQNFDPALNLPNLAFFDKQMGQFTKPETSYAMPLPCILMEYQGFNWETVGKREQHGNGIIRFYIYFENYADAFTGSINQDMALRFFMFTEKVNEALQGYTLPHMAPLLRVADNEDNAEDMIITSTIDYGTILNDISTDESTNFTLTNPTLSVNKVHGTIPRPAASTFADGFTLP